MFGKSKAATALAIGAAAFVVFSFIDFKLRQAHSASDTDGAYPSQPHLTLDPALFNGPVREAYRVAQQSPALLAQLHCYCGCDRTDGHRNLLDCFRDKHGSRCEICVGEAIEASRMAEQGAPVEQIRDALRRRFAPGG